MKHDRSDYNRIQDPDELIPDDEPVFLIRGQDIAGAETVREWVDIAISHGVRADSEIIALALDQADKMEAWAKHKLPDLPK